MFFIYILKSEKHRKHYIGFTNNLRERLKKHNKGCVFSTKPYLPWDIAYYEAYHTKDEAMKREYNLKLRANAWNQLKRRIKESLKFNAD